MRPGASRGPLSTSTMGWMWDSLPVMLLVVLSTLVAGLPRSSGVPMFDRARPDAMPAPKTNAAIALESHGKGRGIRPGTRQYWSSAHCQSPFAYRPKGGTQHPCDDDDLTLSGGSSSKGEHVFENGLRICSNHAIRGQLARYKRSNRHEPAVERIFEPLIRSARPADGDTFVNVGAAIGYYVLEAKRLQPTLGVIGLNPSVVMRERLSANFALNFPAAHSASVESTRFCIDPRGMAENDNETMYIDSQFAGHLVSKEAKERYHSVRRTSAKTVTLATFVEEMDREVFLMMIDVQGLEAKILAAAAAGSDRTRAGTAAAEMSALARGDVKQFLVGIHGSNLDTVVRHLSEAGYEILLSKEPRAFDAGEPDGLVWAVHRTWNRKKEVLALAQQLGVLGR